MKPRPKIKWTRPQAEVVKMDTWTLPYFYGEPQMNAEARRAWDDIVLGSAVKFVSSCCVAPRGGHPYDVIFGTRRSPFDMGFDAGTFGVYIGNTSVKMKFNGRETKLIERSFRTLLIGQTRYLLDDPNVIRVV